MLFTSIVTFITTTQKTYLHKHIMCSLITWYDIHLAGGKLISLLWCTCPFKPIVKNLFLCFAEQELPRPFNHGEKGNGTNIILHHIKLAIKKWTLKGLNHDKHVKNNKNKSAL